jgi:hypothetical protein
VRRSRQYECAGVRVGGEGQEGEGEEDDGLVLRSLSFQNNLISLGTLIQWLVSILFRYRIIGKIWVQANMLKDLLFFNLPILKSKIRIMCYGPGTYDIYHNIHKYQDHRDVIS